MGVTDQFDFFQNVSGRLIPNGQAFARRNDPETSHQAAESVEGDEANRMEQIALNALRNHPNGLTSHELVSVTGLSWNTITPRIRPLIRKGLAEDSGERRIGPTTRRCIVWKAIP